jgi:protein phosphatase
MRILIVSDLHGNAQALDVLPTEYDQLWVLGDLVNYGPDPAIVVDFVRENANVVVRGNHDNAIGYKTDPRCSEPFRHMADAMARFTDRQLSSDQKEYLKNLPLTEIVEVEGTRFFLCHATPSDPLFAYCLPESDQWLSELAAADCDVLLCGHTHIPFVREIDGSLIGNPGSLGQPKIGRPEACYAILENNKITLHSVPYDYETTISSIRALSAFGIPVEIKNALIQVLESGGLLR